MDFIPLPDVESIIMSTLPPSLLQPESHGPSIVRATSLRCCLFGEYLSLLMLCHAVYGMVAWTLYARSNVIGALLMVISTGWIAFRSVGGFAGFRSSAGITAAIVLLLSGISISGVRAVPDWLAKGPVAPLAFVISGMILVIVDILDVRRRDHLALSASERRKSNGRLLRRVIAGLFLLWGFGVPAGTWIWQQARPPVLLPPEEMTFVEHVGFRCGEALVTACFFALGANVGSFLNVVVWRMPIGKSIVHGDSCCPGCGTRIRSRDNIPIFGWLNLGGKCRSCSMEISSRYPTVEFIVAVMFLLLYFCELISGGANLPIRPVNMYRGVLWVIMYAKWDLIGLYFFHCFLFSAMVVWVLMRRDGNVVPWRMRAFTLSVAVTCPLIFPELAVVPAFFPFESPASVSSGFVAALAYAGFGLLTGSLCGLALMPLLRNSCSSKLSMKLLKSDTLWLFGMAGSCLGWQAAITAAMSAIFIDRFIAWAQQHPRTAGPAMIAMVLLLQHLTWRIQWLWWQSAVSGW